MLILYNILQILIVILLFPLLCIYIALKSKYRKHIPRRLGFNLSKSLQGLEKKKKTIWVHALSVGEVTSAVPLVEKIRKDIDDITIIFSASTKTGYEVAQTLLTRHCEQIIPFPLDLFPVVEYFIHIIKPDLFILVETDFWPNILSSLQRKKIPVLLVNGRISKKSMEQYQRLSFFFEPMFHSISHLCVQSDSDRNRLLELGLPAKKVSKMGNLKYESVLSQNGTKVKQLFGSVNVPLFTAGSTHQGEESVILDTYIELKKKIPFKLLIAPRDIKRAEEIEQLAKSRNIETQRRSSDIPFTAELYIIDTIGELLSFYSKSDICFVGGSLVDEGGHNPLEPASRGKPVLFGPNMQDFRDIRDDLIASSGGFTVFDQVELSAMLLRLLEDDVFRTASGEAARNSVICKQGILHDHIQLIRKYL